jgi:putative MATE family efflux protein
MSDPKRPARRAFDPRLLEGSIPRALFLLAVPIMGANILQVAYQVIDAFWVGRLGAAAVASVSITMPVMFVLVAAGMGFAIAGTTLIAQYTGARDHKMVDHVAAQTLVTIVAVSIVLGAIGYTITPWLLHLMKVTPDVYGQALAFMRLIFVALPFTFLYAMGQALMRGVGEVKAPLYIVAGTVFVNFCLDPVLIFGLFGFPAMGVAGAAIATLISQMIAAGIVLRLLFGGRYGIHVHWRDFAPDFAFVKRAFLLGYPASIEQSARGLGMTVLTFLIVSFGTVVTASFGVGANVFNVVIIPAMGFSMATSTLVGQSIGAGNLARA